MTQFQFTPHTNHPTHSHVPYAQAVEAYRASQQGIPPFRARTNDKRGTPLDGAYETLWLKPGAPLNMVKAAYRSLAARNHPDVGGDPAAMLRLNTAYETLRQTLE